MNKYKTLVINTFVIALGNLFSKIVLFLLMPIFTMAFSLEEFGIQDLLTNNIDLLFPIFTLSISESIFRFSFELKNRKGVVNYSIRILLIGSIILYFFLFLFRYFFDFKYSNIFFLMYLSYSIRIFLLQFTRALEKIRVFSISNITFSFFLFILSIFFIKYFELGIYGYLYAFIISNIISIIYLMFNISLKGLIDFKYNDQELFKNLMVFSIPLIPNSVSWWMTNLLGRYFLLFYSNISSVGLFSAAIKIPSLINLASAVFQQAWQVSSIKEYKESGNNIFFNNVLKVYSSFMIVITSVIIFLSPFISKITLSNKFYEAWIIVPILLISALLSSYSYFFGTIYTVVKKNNMIFYSTLLGAVVNIVSSFFLVKSYGILGAALSLVLSNLTIFIIRYYDSKRYIKVEFNIQSFTFQFIAIVIQAMIIFIYKTRYILFLGFITIALALINLKTIYLLIIKKRGK